MNGMMPQKAVAQIDARRAPSPNSKQKPPVSLCAATLSHSPIHFFVDWF
jgi:hypothetical protein